MIIDLRSEADDFRKYLSKRIETHLSEGLPTPKYIHIGFTFDQAGWVTAYFDPRPDASRDGEWTTHIDSRTLLPRPRWHNALELNDLAELRIFDADGRDVETWAGKRDLPKLAAILGEFLKNSIAKFEEQGLFQMLSGTDRVKYCVEEFTGLYGWPVNPDMLKFMESLKLSGLDPNSHSI